MRLVSSIRRMVMAAAVLSLPIAAQVSRQAKPAGAAAQKAAKPYTPPKTPWGDPDLQGNWPASAGIPMQRPAALGERATLTEEEFAQREKQAVDQVAAREAFYAEKVTIGPPANWGEFGTQSRQASLVVDPPDGRIPPLTPQARERMKNFRGGRGPGQHFPTVLDSWEDFDLYSRCISRGFPSTMLPTQYNFGNDITQAPGYVVIRSEMVHETRVVPLDGRPHAGKSIKTYMGDARGHWEGNTLVVETTNLREDTGIGGGLYTEATRITERFTRTAAGELSYDAIIDDPNVWTKPWTIHMPFKMDREYTLYEYACHEGNYMMLDSLSGARELEKQGKDTRVDVGPAQGPLPRAFR